MKPQTFEEWIKTHVYGRDDRYNMRAAWDARAERTKRLEKITHAAQSLLLSREQSNGTLYEFTHYSSAENTYWDKLQTAMTELLDWLDIHDKNIRS